MQPVKLVLGTTDMSTATKLLKALLDEFHQLQKKNCKNEKVEATVG
jgi:hypothetical protein